MSYILILACDNPKGCPARHPAPDQAEPGLSFAEAQERAARAGWTAPGRFSAQHFCPRCSNPEPVPTCTECGEEIKPDPEAGGNRRTTYCSAPCAFRGQDRLKKARAARVRAENPAHPQKGRTGPCRPETARKLARSLEAQTL